MVCVPFQRNRGLAGHRSACASAGFTMIELVAVMVLVSVLSFVAVARLGNVGEVNAMGFAEQLASSMRFAQKAAIAQRRLVYVDVDTTARRLRACLDSAVPCASPLAAPAGGNLDVTAPAGTALASNVTQFSFDGLGRPSATSQVQLVLTAGDGQSFQVLVEVDSGYVHRP